MRGRGVCHWRLIVAALAAVGITALLSGPLATWLQAREHVVVPATRQVEGGGPWSAVYLVAGARAQARRIAALEAWFAAGGRAPLVLIGNDSQKSYYSRPHGRNLTRTEWALEKLAGTVALGTMRREVVPGRFFGTDAEMEALGAYLAARPELRRVALVTCRFHGRRALRRFAAHVPPGVEGGLIPGTPHREDRLPWVVAAELLKLARDRVGLSQAAFLSRSARDG